MGWPSGRLCSATGCKSKHYARGLCRSHYGISTRKKPKVCKVKGCTRSARARGVCGAHYNKLPHMVGREKKCSKCKKPHTGTSNLCKGCHAETEKERRKNLGPQEKELKLQKQRDWYANFRSTLSSKPLNKQVYYWAKRTLKRSKESRFQTRSAIPLKTLIKLALTGFRKFPYMTFSSKQTEEKIADRASLDRIDPTKGYEVLNIRVVPLWLNMAKCDLTDKEFKDRLLTFLNTKPG